MNASVYLFSELNGIYTQYPDDHTVSIFKKFLVNAKSTTQIAIHRDGNLMYYSYIWKSQGNLIYYNNILEQPQYIGFCVVLNGLFINDIRALFYLFDNTISNLVREDKIVVNLNRLNNIIINVEKLYQNQEEIELLAESLREGFNRFEPYAEPLPPVSFGTLKDSRKDFAINDYQEEIVKSSYKNDYTYIYGQQGFNPIKSDNDEPVIQDNDFEFDALKQEQSQTNTLSESSEVNSDNTEKKGCLFVLFFIFIVFWIIMLAAAT